MSTLYPTSSSYQEEEGDGKTGEIRDIQPSDPPFDFFVDFLGSGGTFGGVSSYLKRRSKGAIKCFVVEPKEVSILGEKTF